MIDLMVILLLFYFTPIFHFISVLSSYKKSIRISKQSINLYQTSRIYISMKVVADPEFYTWKRYNYIVNSILITIFDYHYDFDSLITIFDFTKVSYKISDSSNFFPTELFKKTKRRN